MPSDSSMDDPDVGRVEACCISMKRNWTDFTQFLWNPQTKTVLGRTGKSWGRILIFYLFYYSFLAALFAISITVVMNSLDPYKPRFQTRLQTPGVNIQPRLPSRQALNSDIKFNLQDPKSYEKYTEQMKTFLGGYNVTKDNKVLLRNCTNGKIMNSQIFTDGEKAKACVFDPNVLGTCATFPYGYDIGKPCILVKMNKIIDWFPVGYTDISGVKGNQYSKAPSLLDVLNANGAQFKPYKVYVSCYGMKEADMTNLNGDAAQASSATKYFPKDGSIEFKYYPYYGKLRQPVYHTPVVAVQFTNVTRGQLINVGCKAYARNVIDDLRMRVGYYTFELKIDDTKP